MKLFLLAAQREDLKRQYGAVIVAADDVESARIAAMDSVPRSAGELGNRDSPIHHWSALELSATTSLEPGAVLWMRGVCREIFEPRPE